MIENMTLLIVEIEVYKNPLRMSLESSFKLREFCFLPHTSITYFGEQI